MNWQKLVGMILLVAVIILVLPSINDSYNLVLKYLIDDDSITKQKTYISNCELFGYDCDRIVVKECNVEDCSKKEKELWEKYKSFKEAENSNFLEVLDFKYLYNQENLRDSDFVFDENFKSLDSKKILKTYKNLEDIRIKSDSSFLKVSGIDFIKSSSKKFGINPLLVFLVITAESGGDSNAISPTGCVGLAQFCSGTAKDYSLFFKKITSCCDDESARKFVCHKEPKCNLNNDDRFDPKKSILAQTKMLADLQNRYSNFYLILTAYNAGGKVADKCNKDKFLESQDSLINCIRLETRNFYGCKDDSFLCKEVEVNNYLAKISLYENKIVG